MNRMEEINKRKAEIRALLESDKEADLDALEKELRELDDEQAKLEKRAAVAAGIQEGSIPSAKVEAPKDETRTAKYDSEEYRTAFMEYVCRGKELPLEFRADATTATTDIGALVPPVTLNKIVEKIEAYGMILPLVNRTAYKTGMYIPVASIKPTASWSAEGAGSDKQKLPLDAAITFGHFKLRCAVSITLETSEMDGDTLLALRDEVSGLVDELSGPVEIEKGCNMVMSGDYQGGKSVLSEYRDGKYAEWWPLWYYLGVAESALGNSSEAIEAYKKVLTLSPSNTDAMEELASIYALTGDEENAAKYREKIHIIKDNVYGDA